MKDSSRLKMFLYGSISVSIILLAIFASYFLYNRANVEESGDTSGYGYGNGITGYGYADVEVNPDSLVLSFTITTPATDITNGLVRHIEHVTSLEKSLTTLGLAKEDIEKSGYQFCNEYCPTSNEGIEIIQAPADKPAVSEDKISQTFKITLKNLATSQAVVKFLKSDLSIKIEATSLTSADFEDKLQEARIEATKKARENAEQIAQAANLKLGKITSIEDSSSTGYPQDGLPITEVIIKITYDIK